MSEALGPGTFVHVPQINVAVAERVPPGIQHLLIEAQNAFARDLCGWRSERGQTIIDAGAIRIADAREQMPESERVILTRVYQDDAKKGIALSRRGGGKIKFGQCIAERRGSIL